MIQGVASSTSQNKYKNILIFNMDSIRCCMWSGENVWRVKDIFSAPSQCAKERHKASKSWSCVKEKAHDELLLHSMPKNARLSITTTSNVNDRCPQRWGCCSQRWGIKKSSLCRVAKKSTWRISYSSCGKQMPTTNYNFMVC